MLELTDLIVELVPIVTELCFFSLLPLTLIYLVLVLVFICLLIVIILVTRLLLLLVAVEGVSNATLLVVECIGIWLIFFVTWLTAGFPAGGLAKFVKLGLLFSIHFTAYVRAASAE